MPRAAAGILVVALAVGVAACSSGGNTASTTTPTFNPATLQSDVSTPYTTLFNLADKNVDAKIAVIQDGSAIRSSLSEALASPIANSAGGATVHTVTPISTSACQQQHLPAPCAKVVYDIDGPAQPGQSPTAILANSQGYAVYVGGHWLVAKATICGLLGLFYQTEGKTGTPPGC
jgi:hypothetical protein